MTRKVLAQALQQKREIDAELDEYGETGTTLASASATAAASSRQDTLDDGGFIAMEGETAAPSDLDDAERRALESFMSKNVPARRTIADIIFEKIREKGREDQNEDKDGGDEPALSEKFVNAYKRVGKLLKTYKSGKLPKTFKIIPYLRNWEEILEMTEPTSWSNAATLAATRIFASNLNAKMAQRFYNLVLLPKVLANIEDYKKLNFHLYIALKKSLYKPAAFFKGILLPMCENGECSPRAAEIFASILTKVSVPVMHSAAALMKLASLPYSPTNCIFITVLLNKKYTLPYRVIDQMVKFYLGFVNGTQSNLPVVWHQCLLAFVRTYKRQITATQKQSLKILFRTHFHHQITDIVRKELFSVAARGEVQIQKMDTSIL